MDMAGNVLPSEVMVNQETGSFPPSFHPRISSLHECRDAESCERFQYFNFDYFQLKNTHLILEQHGFELRGSRYMLTSFITNIGNIFGDL